MRYSPTSYEEAWNILKQYNVVSFDIWDTLITRVVVAPEDIFRLLEKETGIVGLCDKRIKMVYESRIQNPNIYELYQQLAEKEKWTDEQRDRILETEISLEKRYIRRRDDMVALMERAVLAGKKVCLISDMYLTREHMDSLLNSLDIGGYKELWVSCEYRQLKQDGLLGTFKKSLNDSDTYIHIGDSVSSDIEPATTHNIDTLLIRNGRELLMNSPYYSLLDKMGETVTEHIIVGAFVAEMFNSPFVKVSRGKRLLITDTGVITRCFIAPLIVEYTRYLINRCIEEQYDTVLFSARDGYLIQKIYRIWKEQIVSKGIGSCSGLAELDDFYFYASRQLCTVASLYSREDVEWLVSVPFEGSETELLKERFGVDKKCEKSFLPDDRTGFVDCYCEDILEHAKRTRENYLSYIDKLGIRGRKNCFYDFVSSGTCQYYLDKIGLKDLQGEYFCYSRTQDERSKSKINGYYLNDGIEHAQSAVFKNYQFLELVMTSLEGSVMSVDEAGTPGLAVDPRTAEELGLVQNMHEEVIEYAEKYFELIHDFEELQEGKEAAELVYGFLADDFTDLSKSELSVMTLKDDWTGAKKTTSASGEDPIVKAIRNKEDVSKILESNDTWEHLYQFSSMRHGIIDWYPFEQDAHVLEINAKRGALTCSLCRRVKGVIALTDTSGDKELIETRCSDSGNVSAITSEDELQSSDLFDYILIDGFKTGDELKYLKYLKESGRALVCVTNSKGARYQCGYPLPENEVSFTKNEITKQLKNSGVSNWKFYYPLPDYVMTQEVYTDSHLPTSSIRDRVVFYYPEANKMNRDENDCYDEAVRKGTFAEVCNSFLIETSISGEMENIVYATTSSDRVKERRFSVAIYPDKVVKKPISKEAERISIESCENLEELTARGLHTVPCRLEEATQVMPFIEDKRAVEYIYENFKEDKERGLDAIDRLVDCIKKSSDMDSNGNLSRGYIDLIPINAFVCNDEYIFYDQEFVEDNCDIGYIIFRTLRYLYLQYEDLENIISIDELKSRYQVSQKWSKYLDMENEFIFHIRNHKENHTFYRLAGNGYHKKNNPFEHKNIMLVNGYDRFEFGEENFWSWAISSTTTMLLGNNQMGDMTNDKSKEDKFEFSCDLLPPLGLECGRVRLLINGEEKELVTPTRVTMEVSKPSKLVILVENELVSPGNGDPRRFAFQLVNPRWTELN